MELASASYIVKFHDLTQNGSVKYAYQPKTNPPSTSKKPQSSPPHIRTISWSRNGEWLAIVPYTGSTEIVTLKNEPSTPKLLHTVHRVRDPSCATFQNTSKRYLGIGTLDGRALLYDLKCHTIKTHFNERTSVVGAFNSAVQQCRFTVRDAHFVVSAGGALSAFSTVNNVETRLVGGVNNNNNNNNGRGDEKGVSGGGLEDGLIRTLDVNVLRSGLMAIGYDSGTVSVWDLNRSISVGSTGSSRLVMTVKGAHRAPVNAVAFSPFNSDLLASGGLDRAFCFYDIGGGTVVHQLTVESSVSSMVFAPDGRSVVFGTQRGRIHVHDIRKFSPPLMTFDGHDSPVKHIAFRPTDGATAGNTTDLDIVDSPAQTDSESIIINLKKTNNKTKSPTNINSMQTNNLSFIDLSISPLSVVTPNKKKCEDSFLAMLGNDTQSITSKTNHDTNDNNNVNSVNKSNVNHDTPELKRLQCVKSTSGAAAATPSPSPLPFAIITAAAAAAAAGGGGGATYTSTPLLDGATKTNNGGDNIGALIKSLEFLHVHQREEFSKLDQNVAKIDQSVADLREEVADKLALKSAEKVAEGRALDATLAGLRVDVELSVDSKLEQLKGEILTEMCRYFEGLVEENTILRNNLSVAIEELNLLRNN